MLKSMIFIWNIFPYDEYLTETKEKYLHTLNILSTMHFYLERNEILKQIQC